MTPDDLYLVAKTLRSLTPDPEGATVGEHQQWSKLSAALLQLGRRNAPGFDPTTFLTWLKPEERPAATPAAQPARPSPLQLDEEGFASSATTTNVSASVGFTWRRG